MVTLNDVTVREGTRYFTATVDGVRYEIPEMWSVGYCTTHGGTALDAALAWHEQSVMAAESGRAAKARINPLRMRAADIALEYIGRYGFTGARNLLARRIKSAGVANYAAKYRSALAIVEDKESTERERERERAAFVAAPWKNG